MHKTMHTSGRSLSVIILVLAAAIGTFFLIVHLKANDIVYINPTAEAAQVSGAGSGLVGYWPFDEGSGTTAADTSGTGANGTLTGGPTWVTGKIGGALSFGGSMKVTTASTLGLTSNSPVTWSAWLYQPTAVTASQNGVMSEYNGLTQGFEMEADNSARMRCGVDSSSGQLFANFVVPTATWYFTLCEWNNGTLTIWTNGVQTGSASVPTLTIPSSNFQIGTVQNTGSYHGYIDDVRVYNRALSASEISDLYAYTGPAAGGGGGSSDTSAPSVPSGLAASAVSSTAINLSWTASTDDVAVTGYKIFRGALQVGTSATNSFSDTGLTASTQYSYTVSAYDAAGNNSVQSSSASGTTQAGATDSTAPSVPTGVSATALSSSQVSLSWTASTDNVGVSGYKVYRNSSQIATPNSNSYSDTGLTASTQYSYTVAAYDAAGNTSAQSTSASATTQSSGGGGSTDTTPPVVSAVTSSSVTSSAATITWTTDESSDSQVEYGLTTTYGSVTSLNSSLAISHSIVLSGLSANTQYHYRVKSKDASGNLTNSGDNIFTTSAASGGLVDCSSGTQSVLQLAITAAANGATITCITNTYTWSPVGAQTAGITIPSSKGITINGNGSTIITSGTGQNNPGIMINTNTITPSRITGFIFTSGADIAAHGSKNSAPYRIDNNTFTEPIGAGATFLYLWDDNPGLIDSNHFTAPDNAEMIHNNGYGPDAQPPPGWVDDITPGSWNALYVETNTFTNDGSSFGGNSAIQSYYGSRMVFRNNILNTSQVDEHGTASYIGARWWEIYGNTFNVALIGPSYNQSEIMDIRAGSGVIFGNTTVTGSHGNGGAGNLKLREEDTGQTAGDLQWPFLYQIGRGKNETSDPAYLWGNVAKNMGSASASVMDGRDFFSNTCKPGYAPFTYPYPLDGNGLPNPSAGNNSNVICSSGGVSDTTAPSTPTGLSASTVSSSQINLTWTASTDNVGVAGYKIYRGGVQVATSVTNSYSNTGLTPSTLYSYTVQAYDAAGNNSSQSSAASATTQAVAGDTTPPSIPTSLSASVISSTQINLTWTASTDNVAVTGYKIFRGGVQISTSATNSYSNTGLTASTLYSYTVSAYDAAGNNSSQSISVSGTTQSGGDITAPTVSITSPTAGTVSGSVALHATASDNVGVVGVQFKLDAANLGQELSTSPYSGLWDTTGVSNGSHTLTAVARDAAGNIKTSTAVTVTVSNSAATFVLAASRTGSGSGTVTGNGINCGTTCVVTVNSGTAATLTATPSSGSTFTGWTGACTNTSGTCNVTVTATTNVAATFVIAQDTQAPTVPSGLAPSSLIQTGVTLSWTASTDNVGVVGYNIFKNGTLIASPTTNTYAVSGLSALTIYTFTISAYDGAGNTSSLSTPLSITTTAVQVPTLSLTAVKSGSGTGTISGNGLNCGSICLAQVTLNTQVSLTATPNVDSTFDGWSGACSGIGTCSTTALGALNVSAIFTLIPVITTPPSGGGGGGGGGGGVPAGSVGSIVSTVGTFTPTVPQNSVVTTVATPCTITTSGGSFTRSLTLGSTGSDVMLLQVFLNSKGFTIASSGNGSPGHETTYFGPATQSALARFQAANAISPAAGYFGPITMAKANSLSGGKITSSCATSIPVTTTTTSSSFTRDLTLGSTGSDVQALQVFLNNHGFLVSASGAGSKGNESTYFGMATQAALARFQAANGISPAAGYFGAKTRAVLSNMR